MRRLIDALERKYERERLKIQKEHQQRYNGHQRSLIEPLWYLRGIPYQQYLTSHHWKRRSDLYKATFGANLQCEVCHISSVYEETQNYRLDWLPHFHVHHVSYDNLGNEDDDDLLLVCSSCHNAIHFPYSASAKFWIEYSHLTLSELEALKPRQKEQQRSSDNLLNCDEPQ